jgi:hypothetical protein
MNAVKVQYTVKEAYVETNKRNIQRVMAELRGLNNPGIKYSSFLLDDGKTFVHFGMYADEEAKSVVGDLDSFKRFRQELQESQPDVPPKAEELNLVASAYDIF